MAKNNTPEIDYGRYESVLSDAEISKAHKMRMIFLHLSALFFAITLFLPVDARESLSPILWLFSAYVFFDLALIIAIVWVGGKATRSQRIQSVLNAKAAKGGFLKKHTFWCNEILTVMYCVYAVAEIALNFVLVEVWSVLSAVCAVASAVLCVLARNVAFSAYKNARFIEPISQENPTPPTDKSTPPQNPDDENAAENFYEE